MSATAFIHLDEMTRHRIALLIDFRYLPAESQERLHRFLEKLIGERTEAARAEMTPGIRDQFASHAMQSMVGAAAFNQGVENMMKLAGLEPEKDFIPFVADLAYQWGRRDARGARESSPFCAGGGGLE